MSLLDRLLAAARGRSPWIYCANAGSCNGCDIEMAACLAPRYDPEQIGVLRQGSPKHADILLITGPLTTRSLPAIGEIYAQIPRPLAVVAVGSCPASGNVFTGSPTVKAPLDQVIPVDVFVPGCPPRPQTILEGIRQAARLLAEGKTRAEPYRGAPPGSLGPWSQRPPAPCGICPAPWPACLGQGGAARCRDCTLARLQQAGRAAGATVGARPEIEPGPEPEQEARA